MVPGPETRKELNAACCRIALSKSISRRLRCAPPRPGTNARPPALGGPGRARARPARAAGSPDQSAHPAAHKGATRMAPALSGRRRGRMRPDGHGSLIRFRLCRPPGQAGQGQLRCRTRWRKRHPQLDSSSPAAQLTRPDTVKAALTSKRPRRRVENDEYAAFVRRIPRLWLFLGGDRLPARHHPPGRSATMGSIILIWP